jgi:hypothetical protein
MSKALAIAIMAVVLGAPAWGQDGGRGHGGDDEDYTGMLGMTGALGPYLSTREASGTSWQPDSARHDGLHFMAGDWTIMAHGEMNAIYSDQGGPRGDEKGFLAGMAMASARKSVGAGGALTLRAMLSLDPQMGKSGYPLLFAAGETADGVEHLIDRQHPHNFFMELAASFSQDLGEGRSIFIYAGLPGEPALGPSAFMHRISGMDNPEAPIAHHWLDSTHIANGVMTLGYVHERWKFEGSVFTGREPDQNRYEINDPHLDSWSGRVTWNPGPNWSMQISFGAIESPEQLEPELDEKRFTASATYNKPLGDNNWSATLAWGRKDLSDGRSFDAILLESAFTFADEDTILARLERIETGELFGEKSPLHGVVARPVKLSLGYIHDFALSDGVKLGVGGLASVYGYSSALDAEYGTGPISTMIFMRLKLS